MVYRKLWKTECKNINGACEEMLYMAIYEVIFILGHAATNLLMQTHHYTALLFVII